MSNVETHPAELLCRGARDGAPAAVEVLEPRDVPLGGPRAMTVRRTLPQRTRSLIGAWCFADHYGPDDVSRGGGMDVPPHPHTGLQTVSWLFAGKIEHRDSQGVHAMVRPGELNLMTGGHGICHSEVSVADASDTDDTEDGADTTVLHGVQLWVALPQRHRDTARDFQHHVPEPVAFDGATVRVFLGSLCGEASPVRTFTPLLGAEITLAAGARLDIDVDPTFEHGVLVDTGALELAGTRLSRGALGYVGSGTQRLSLANRDGGPTRMILLGGVPFEEEILMWWNFVARTHEEIVRFRDEWQRESERFGRVAGYSGRRLPAPALPAGRLRPRQNPSPG